MSVLKSCQCRFASTLHKRQDACVTVRTLRLRAHQCTRGRLSPSKIASRTSTALAATSAPAALRAPEISATVDDWKQSFQGVAQRTSEESSDLVEMTFKGKISANQPYRSVTVRPVMLKSDLNLQFSYFRERQNIVKNALPTSDEASKRLDELLNRLPFNSVTLKTHSQGIISVQVTKSGKAIIHKTSAPAAVTRGPIQMTHDRKKGLPIPPDVPHPFLQRIGMQTAEGRLKADMVDKMAQVNDFLKLLGHTGVLDELRKQTQASATGENGHQQSRPVRILDCGCGSSHLTFGVWHYLNNVLGVKAQLVGIDSNAALMAKCNTYCTELGLSPAEANFIATPIEQYQPGPDQAPDVVLALHACDTATDDALALGVRLGASLIMAVPCCHKHLHKQLSGSKALLINPLQPLMKQGITKQRMLDMATDTMRAQLLRVCGYKTDVVEFVSTEHTPRNILIRAVKQSGQDTISVKTAGSDSETDTSADGVEDAAKNGDLKGYHASLSQEYVAFRDFFGHDVQPKLEGLLQQRLPTTILRSK